VLKVPLNTRQWTNVFTRWIGIVSNFRVILRWTTFRLLTTASQCRWCLSRSLSSQAETPMAASRSCCSQNLVIIVPVKRRMMQLELFDHFFTILHYFPEWSYFVKWITRFLAAVFLAETESSTWLHYIQQVYIYAVKELLRHSCLVKMHAVVPCFCLIFVNVVAYPMFFRLP